MVWPILKKPGLKMTGLILSLTILLQIKFVPMIVEYLAENALSGASGPSLLKAAERDKVFDDDLD
jgi:hypothetical protein